MNNYPSQIINRVFNAIDSDDIQEIALLAESTLSKEQIYELQKMLKTELQEKDDTSDKADSIKQFLNFME